MTDDRVDRLAGRVDEAIELVAEGLLLALDFAAYKVDRSADASSAAQQIIDTAARLRGLGSEAPTEIAGGGEAAAGTEEARGDACSSSSVSVPTPSGAGSGAPTPTEGPADPSSLPRRDPEPLARLWEAVERAAWRSSTVHVAIRGTHDEHLTLTVGRHSCSFGETAYADAAAWLDYLESVDTAHAAVAAAPTEAPAADMDEAHRRVQEVLASRTVDSLHDAIADIAAGSPGTPEEPAERTDEWPDGWERIAICFHRAYEDLAPQHGYETREDSAKPWDQVPLQNRRLMIRTVGHVLRDMQDFGWTPPRGSEEDSDWLIPPPSEPVTAPTDFPLNIAPFPPAVAAAPTEAPAATYSADEILIRKMHGFLLSNDRVWIYEHFDPDDLERLEQVLGCDPLRGYVHDPYGPRDTPAAGSADGERCPTCDALAGIDDLGFPMPCPDPFHDDETETCGECQMDADGCVCGPVAEETLLQVVQGAMPATSEVQSFAPGVARAVIDAGWVDPDTHADAVTTIYGLRSELAAAGSPGTPEEPAERLWAPEHREEPHSHQVLPYCPEHEVWLTDDERVEAHARLHETPERKAGHRVHCERGRGPECPCFTEGKAVFDAEAREAQRLREGIAEVRAELVSLVGGLEAGRRVPTTNEYGRGFDACIDTVLKRLKPIVSTAARLSADTPEGEAP